MPLGRRLRTRKPPLIENRHGVTEYSGKHGV